MSRSEVEEAARARYDEQVAIARNASRGALAAWRELDLDNIPASWLTLVNRRVWAQLHAAQLLVVRGARGYVERVVEAHNRRRRRPVRPSRGHVAPERLAGVAADGRPLPSLLYQPAITTLRAIERGASPREAAAVGGTQLDMIVRSEVADSGRVATGVQIAATPGLGYVRMIVAPACARCAILAGRFYRWNQGFLRHPRCQCVHIPASEDQADDLATDPRRYFDSLSEQEQRRIFTVDGAQAIRDGADIARVVNARRGMYTASVGDRTVRATREATRRRSRQIRLMPEQIYREAGGSRDEALRLLRLHGYLTDPGRSREPSRPDRTATPAQRPAPAPSGFEERIADAAADREALNAAPAGLVRGAAGAPVLSRAQRGALRDYESSFYYAINGVLRRGAQDAQAARRVARIDEVMAASRLTRDSALWRGAADASRLFGDRLQRDLTGLQWREQAYVSTSAVRQVGVDFTYPGASPAPVLMRILAPRGTGAVRISRLDDQAEVLLQRGLTMRVVRDRGVSPQGYRLLDVEVVTR